MSDFHVSDDYITFNLNTENNSSESLIIKPSNNVYQHPRNYNEGEYKYTPQSQHNYLLGIDNLPPVQTGSDRLSHQTEMHKVNDVKRLAQQTEMDRLNHLNELSQKNQLVNSYQGIEDIKRTNLHELTSVKEQRESNRKLVGAGSFCASDQECKPGLKCINKRCN